MKSLLVLLFCGLIGVIFYLFLNKIMKKKVEEANAKAKNKPEIFLENESVVKNFDNKKLSVISNNTKYIGKFTFYHIWYHWHLVLL